MATKIDELYVEIDARFSKLEKGLKESTKKSQESSKKIEKSFLRLQNPINAITGGLTKMMGPLIAAAGVTGLSLLAKNSLNAADQIAKTADNIGITTDLLQEMRLAAELTGVSQNDLESSLMRFNRRLAEAASGTGEFAKAYKALDIAVVNANGSTRNAEEVLFDVADKVSKLGSESEQAAVLFKIFGDSGFRLVNMFKGGAEQLQAFRQQAREMGIVIREDLLRNAEKTNDQLSVLSKVVSTQVSEAFLKLAPHIQKVAEVLSRAMVGLASFLDKFEETPDDKIAELNDQLQELRVSYKHMSDIAGESSKATEKSQARARQMVVKLRAEIEKTEEQIRSLFNIQAQSDRQTAAASESIIASLKKREELEKRVQAIVSEAGKRDQVKKVEEEIELLRDANEQKIEIEGELNEALIEKQAELEEAKTAAREREIQELMQRNALLENLDASANEAEIKANEEKIRQIAAQERQGSMLALKVKTREVEKKRQLEQQTLQATSGILGNISSLRAFHSKEAFEIGKRAAQAQAIVDGILAVQKALASAPPPINAILAASVGIKTAANVAAIESQTYAKGGEVPGSGFKDSVPIIATPHETVIDRSLTKQLKQDAGGSQRIVAAIMQLQRVIMTSMNMTPSFVMQIGDSEIFNAVQRQIRAGRRLATS